MSESPPPPSAAANAVPSTCSKLLPGEGEGGSTDSKTDTIHGEGGSTESKTDTIHGEGGSTESKTDTIHGEGDSKESLIDTIHDLLKKSTPLSRVQADTDNLLKYLENDPTHRNEMDGRLAACLQSRKDSVALLNSLDFNDERVQEVQTKLKDMDVNILWYLEIREAEKGFSEDCSNKFRELQSWALEESAAIEDEYVQLRSSTDDLLRKLRDGEDPSHVDLIAPVMKKQNLFVKELQLISRLKSDSITRDEDLGANAEAVRERRERRISVDLGLGQVEAAVDELISALKGMRLRGENLDQVSCDLLNDELEKGVRLRKELAEIDTELKGLRRGVPVEIVLIETRISRLKSKIKNGLGYRLQKECDELTALVATHKLLDDEWKMSHVT